mmetsp:Transcript_72850/g.144371  ORF Transcript_72850/g.144371 Transcript_72850/m.144371 type:complete len:507 (-) Transcript_72850:113-1633(-)
MGQEVSCSVCCTHSRDNEIMSPIRSSRSVSDSFRQWSPKSSQTAHKSKLLGPLRQESAVPSLSCKVQSLENAWVLQGAISPHSHAEETAERAISSTRCHSRDILQEAISSTRCHSGNSFHEAVSSMRCPAKDTLPEEISSMRCHSGGTFQEAKVPTKFSIELHTAHLSRSFAKIGWMDPYAVIVVDSSEVARTRPDAWAHRDPKWEASFSWTSQGVPGAVTVSIWDKNHFHKDVLCGAVTVPCDAEMGHLEKREFTLTKRDRPTGSVCLSLHAESGCFLPVRMRSRTLSGMEFDNMVNWSLNDSETPRSAPSVGTVCLREADNAAPAAEADLIESGNESEALDRVDAQASASPACAVQPVKQSGSDQGIRVLVGSWKCVETNGLDEFLKATGVGVFQRKIAKAAKWPRWEYNMVDELLVFVNHSAIGDLREDLLIGEEYTWRDGHGNTMMCMAEWRSSPSGGTLLITRSGPLGSYTEERCVTGDRLVFTLTNGSGVAWGRSFVRDK